LLAGIIPDSPLRATHAVAAIMAKVTIAIADRNRTTVVAAWSVDLERGELFAAGRIVIQVQLELWRHARAFQ
jgi:hypothetical protein